MVVLGAGTGGTITGVGRKLKEKLRNIKVVYLLDYLLLLLLFLFLMFEWLY